MKTAKDYPITWGYGEKTTINGQPYTHRGVDRAMPVGTPIVIEGVTIAYSGNTGLSTGPHLHSQAGTDFDTQKTVNAKGKEFKPGKVVAIRTTDSGSWGKYVRIQNEDGTYITYAHLSKVTVKVGKVIKEADMLTTKAAQVIVRAYIGETASVGELTKYVGKVTTNEFIDIVKTWKRYEANLIKAKQGKLIAKNHLMYTIRKDYVDPKDAVIKDLRRDVATLTKERNAANDKVTKLTRQLLEAGEENAALKMEVDAKKDEIEELNKMIAVKNEEIDRLIAELKDCGTDCDKLTGWELIALGLRKLLGKE